MRGWRTSDPDSQYAYTYDEHSEGQIPLRSEHPPVPAARRCVAVVAYGRWPNINSGLVPGTIDDTWARIADSLLKGYLYFCK